MNNQPSRLSATIDLACAAMTILFCGELTREQRGNLVRSVDEVTPLIEEFADILAESRKGMKWLVHCFPDLTANDYYCKTSKRKYILLRVRQMPSTLRQIMAEFLSDYYGEEIQPGTPLSRLIFPEMEELARSSAIDLRHLRYCFSTNVDLDAQWHAMREALLKVREGRRK